MTEQGRRVPRRPPHTPRPGGGCATGAGLTVGVPLAEEPPLRVLPLGHAGGQDAHERRDVPGAGLAVRPREAGQLVEQAAGLVEVAEDAGLMLAGPALPYPLGDPVRVLSRSPSPDGPRRRATLTRPPRSRTPRTRKAAREIVGSACRKTDRCGNDVGSACIADGRLVTPWLPQGSPNQPARGGPDTLVLQPREESPATTPRVAGVATMCAQPQKPRLTSVGAP